MVIGGPVAIKVTTKTNYDNEVKLSRKTKKDCKYKFTVFCEICYFLIENHY